MPSATTTPHPIQTSETDIPAFPSPSTLSIVPEIYLLLARLNIVQQSQTSETQPTIPTTLQVGDPIQTKDLLAQIYPLRQKLTKARAAVSTLPDVDRSVDAQEKEIAELERDVGLLKKRLAKLGGIARIGREGHADTAMQGVEG
jgi:hypothetical protein